MADNNTPLVETDWLADHLEDPGVRVFDCTVFLTPREDGSGYDRGPGREKYQEEHIPGAAFLDLLEDFTDNDPVPFMLPEGGRFAAACAANGISADAHIVLYSVGSLMFATRMWWMLRAFGIDASVLNGGIKKWKLEGRALSTGDEVHETAEVTVHFHPEVVAGKADVLDGIGDDGVCIVNALTAAQHVGEGGVGYGRAGRIAGSVNVPTQELVTDDGSFLDLDVLRARFETSGAMNADRVIPYCGGGIAASTTVFLLHLLGHENVALYDASLSEWAADESLPMEVG